MRQEKKKQLRSSNNLKQIGVALHNYHGVYKTLPPPAKTADGKPLLSWRVLILPFLEDDDNLYAQFKLDEPWDSPHNIKLLTKMPEVYAHPADPEAAKKGLTYYQVFVGEPGGFPTPIFPKQAMHLALKADFGFMVVLKIQDSQFSQRLSPSA